jgi:hypothetical protein
VLVLDESTQRVRPTVHAYSGVAIVTLDAAVDHLQALETVFLIRRGVARNRFISNPFEAIEVCPRMAAMAGVAEEEVTVETAEVNLVV